MTSVTFPAVTKCGANLARSDIYYASVNTNEYSPDDIEDFQDLYFGTYLKFNGFTYN